MFYFRFNPYDWAIVKYSSVGWFCARNTVLCWSNCRSNRKISYFWRHPNSGRGPRANCSEKRINYAWLLQITAFASKACKAYDPCQELRRSFGAGSGASCSLQSKRKPPAESEQSEATFRANPGVSRSRVFSQAASRIFSRAASRVSSA